MNTTTWSTAPFRPCWSLILTLAAVTLPTAAALAQTNAAAQAVRQRVQGLDGGGGGAEESPPASSSTGKIDLSYVPSDAVAVVVLHPAKLMASKLAQQLPVEVISAYGLKYTGFDPAKVNEVVAFGQMPGGEAQGYGLVAKFNEPFKGSAIPASLRGAAKLGDLNGRRYLQSPDPAGRSFYGPDNKTLIVAPDATLRQVVASKDQPKAGPLIDRVLAAPADSDAYVTVDVASLRPMMQMVQLYAQQAPPEAQQFFEAPNLISAIELTLDVSAPSPMTMVIHANDEASADKLESLVQSGVQMQQALLKAQVAQTAAGDDPIAAAMARFQERMSGQWAPQREGAKLIFFRTDGEDAREKQLALAASVGFLAGKLSSFTQGAEQPPGEFPGGLLPDGPPPADQPRDEHAEPPRYRDSDR